MSDPNEDIHVEALQAENARFRELVREVIADHADPDSAWYNECGDVVCDWCSRAKQIVEAGDE